MYTIFSQQKQNSPEFFAKEKSIYGRRFWLQKLIIGFLPIITMNKLKLETEIFIYLLK